MIECVNLASGFQFDPKESLLWTGGLNHSMGVLKTGPNHNLDLFLTSRTHAGLEGKWQTLIHLDGPIWAVTVDEYSGKILVLSSNVERVYQVTELDFGNPEDGEWKKKEWEVDADNWLKLAGEVAETKINNNPRMTSEEEEEADEAEVDKILTRSGKEVNEGMVEDVFDALMES